MFIFSFFRCKVSASRTQSNLFELLRRRLSSLTNLEFVGKGTAISAFPQSHVYGICIPQLWYFDKKASKMRNSTGDLTTKKGALMTITSFLKRAWHLSDHPSF